MKKIYKKIGIVFLMLSMFVLQSFAFIPKKVFAGQSCPLNSFYGTVTVNGTLTDNVAVTLTDVTNNAPALTTTTSMGGFYSIESGNLATCASVGDQIKLDASFGGLSISVTTTYALQAMTNVNLQIIGVVTPILTTINVTPSAPSVVVGGTQQMTAVTLDQNGNPITATVGWSSSNTAVGTINATSGLFTAVSVGTTTVMAMSGTVMGSATVSVVTTPPPTTTYTITSSVGTGGTINPSGATVVNSGGNQSYTIVPSTGYSITDVLVDGVSVGAITTYNFTNVTANHTISASFTAIPTTQFAITSSAGANGSISPLGMTMVNSGATQTYTITPGTGYQVLDVLVDGTSVGAVATYDFLSVTANHTISATFTYIPVYTSISVSPLTPSIVVGNTQQFTATALDQNGAPMVTQPTFTWSSADPCTLR